jgi:hypothetical protein
VSDDLPGACCAETVPVAPLPVDNPPGLAEIARRIGTHSSVKAALLRGLSRPDLPALAELHRRDDADFAVALLDAAASAVDVLTFYVQRYANEHYLRTATELRSMAELGQLVGYQVRPGLAATADLAFTLQTAPGAPAEVLIAAGTAVQSSPEAGEQPVIYETVEDLPARPAFNAIRPRARAPQPEPGFDEPLRFTGTATNIRVGDGVAYRTSTGTIAFGLVTSVRSVDAVPELPGRPGSPGRTEVMLDTKDCVRPPTSDLFPPSGSAPPAGTAVTWLAGRKLSAEDLDAELSAHNITLDVVAAGFGAAVPAPDQALVFRQQVPLFGSQAPRADTVLGNVLDEVKNRPGVPALVWWWVTTHLSLPWETATLAAPPVGTAGNVYLDGPHPDLGTNSMIVLRDGASWGGYRIADLAVESVAAQSVSGRATHITVDNSEGLQYFSIRRTVAYGQPEMLALADKPLPETVPVDVIELDGLALGLRTGRRVLVTGEAVADRGNPVVHATTLSTVEHDFGPRPLTRITLARFLPAALARSTVVIQGNVVPASHGQTRTEPLGSGDATAPFQRFPLRQPPLTYLSASSGGGLASTLSIWVDGARWTEVDTLVDAGPQDRVYVVRDVDGVFVVEFGDGVTGARLPTGTANVYARYRSGSGLAGRVGAGRLTMPLSRAGGVSEVTNPAAAEGGDDPEPVDAARVNVPLTVKTLDRVVSIVDYADYARAFPGVAKASGVWIRSAGHRGILLTIAGPSGSVLDPAGEVGTNLHAALRGYGDPLVPVVLVSHVSRVFRVSALVKVAPDRDRDTVLTAAQDALRAAFSFTARDLGQPVAASEVMAILHAVPGVQAATPAALWVYQPGIAVPPPGPPPAVLVAAQPAPGTEVTATGPTVTGAELLTLDSAPVTWGVLT